MRTLYGTILAAVCEGAHIVLSMPHGGESFSLSFLDASDENMTVKSVAELDRRG